MSQPSKPACGPSVDVAKNDGARVARCPCGTLHVHILRSGVSVQLGAEAFAEVADAIAFAHRALERRTPSLARAEHDAQGRSAASTLPRGRGEFVTVQITPTSPGKKPSMN